MRIAKVVLFSLLSLVAACSGGGDGGGDPLESIVVAPDGATIDTGTTIEMRATGVTKNGRHLPVTGTTWTATNGTIDADGNFTPSAAGDAVISASAQGFEADATVHVVAAGTLDALVVDAATGAGITGAFVSLVATTGASAVTVGDGTTTLTGSFSGEVDLLVRATNYHPVALYDVKVKDLRVPMRSSVSSPSGTLTGTIDFREAYDRDDPPSGSLWVGFVGAAIKGNILAFGFDSLLGPNRPLTDCGLPVDAPSNVYIHGCTAEYIAGGPAGPSAAWALGGEVTLQEISEIASNTGSSDLGVILAQALPIFQRFFYAVETGLTIASNQTLSGIDLVLDTRLSQTANLEVPPRPVTDPNPLVVAAADLGATGFVPVGLGIVEGENELTATIKVPPLADSFVDSSYIFLVVTQEGGTGTAGAEQQIAVLSRGNKSTSGVVLPDFFVPPAFNSFQGTGSTRVFAHAATDGADFTLQTFSRTVTSGTGGAAVVDRYEWDVLTAGGSTGYTLPALAGTHAAMTGGNWTVQSVGLESQTYEAVLTPAAPVDVTTYFNDANRIVITNADVD